MRVLLSACVYFVFLSTLSLRRATVKSFMRNGFFLISIHALLAESDHTKGNNLSYYFHFYPRSPCGERQLEVLYADGPTMISIHALLAESDPHCNQQATYFFYFYPRSPCGERRKPNKLAGLKLVFLSTLSLRRATKTT